jgi:hypothetical protein
MKEEEAEREEALQAAATEMEAADGGMMDDTIHPGEEVMERDLDEDIPNGEEEPSGLVEEGEEGLEEEGDEFMERDLDDDIPEGFVDDEYEGSGLYDDDDEDDDDFDNQPDLDAEIPSERDLDDDIPDAEGSVEEWQHTDSEEELSDEDEESLLEPGVAPPSLPQPSSARSGSAQPRFAENFRTSTPNSRGGLPQSLRREQETDAQRRFINRWSGGGDAFDSSSMLYSDEDLRASMTSQSSRRSEFARRFPRRIGGPRDSLN